IAKPLGDPPPSPPRPAGPRRIPPAPPLTAPAQPGAADDRSSRPLRFLAQLPDQAAQRDRLSIGILDLPGVVPCIHAEFGDQNRLGGSAADVVEQTPEARSPPAVYGPA